MKLFPSILISLKKEYLKEGNVKSGEVIGNRITATTLKNRMYPPFQQATVEIDYKTGINGWAGIMDLAVQSGVISKGGSWYTYGTDKVQGEQNAMEWLPKIPNLIDKLDKWLESTGYSTYNEEVKQAEKLMEEEESKEEVKKKKKIVKKEK